MPIYHGQHKNYHWLQCNNLHLDYLVEASPAIVYGKRVVVTSFDSGPLVLSESELSRGWTQKGPLAISPPITDVESIPTDQYDEWFIFNNYSEQNIIEVFVNYGGFSLRNPDYLLKGLDPTWDKKAAESEIENILTLQQRFWDQMVLLQPECYLADGDNFIFVARDENLIRETFSIAEEIRVEK
jgi:hypothetical protein